MELKNLSELIKIEREKRKITFEKIHQDTKIPIKFLKYIEEEKWENFPSEVHKRAIIKKYLDYLKIEVPIENLFKKNEEFEKDAIEKKHIKRTEIKERILNRKVFFIFILFVLFLILFFFTNYYLQILSK